jgi:hypothetical protein
VAMEFKIKSMLNIVKKNAEDCPTGCRFRDDSDGFKCTIFNARLNRFGYYDKYTAIACYKCQELFNKENYH